MVQATVLIPTYNHGPTLYYSVACAQEQTIQDIEIFIIGDGVSEVSRKIVTELANKDSRIHFFDHPKGPRYGEIYRNPALSHAQGKIVCYLSDDSLWLPDHIETMLDLLKEADFASTLFFAIHPDGRFDPWPNFDSSDPSERAWALAQKDQNSIPIALPCVAHTMEMFRTLPFGWRTTPEGLYSDQYMWQQFFAQSECRVTMSTKPTVLIFSDSLRKGWTIEKRVAELEHWKQKMATQRFKEKFLFDVLDSVARTRFQEAKQLRRTYETTTWRLGRFVSQIPLFGKIMKVAAKWVADRLSH